MTARFSFSTRLYVLLSLFVLLINAAFVAINWYSANKTLRASLQKQSENLQTSLEVSVSQAYQNLLQISTLISANSRVQELFLAGKKAVEAEGGGAGGPLAAQYRNTLYQVLAPGWDTIMQQYNARQLHFHLGPGSLSFLRVHQPDRFGDRMDEIRHIIVDTNTYRRANIGFETGRVDSGLRAVVPVFANSTDGSEKIFVGSVEVGTSFTSIINSLENITAAKTLVLLKEAHVRNTMWGDFIANQLELLDTQCRCFIEAASSQRAIEIFLATKDRLSYKNERLQTYRSFFEGKYYSVSRFPLFDYKAKQRPDGAPVGSIAIMTDISEAIINNQEQLRINLSYALLGFIIIESLLYFALRFGTRQLRSIIDTQTAEITQLKEYFEQQATIDSLTQLRNRRYLIDRLDEEMERARRTQLKLSLVMLDLDFFKAFNDTFGHRVGDEVLKATALLIQQVSRSGDVPARYGGEEFCLLLPNTDRAGAGHIAQRLLENIRERHITLAENDQNLSWTASFGVAQWDGQESMSDFIHRTDVALYRAKETGRNRIEFAHLSPSSEDPQP